MSLDLKSTRCLEGVHPDLVSVIERASEAIPFRVTEGLRTKQRQAELVKQGKSRTMNSRHLTGHAIDFVDPQGSYDEAEMRRIADTIKQAANDLGVPVTWGGDWTKFCDRPHIELEWHAYPASSFAAKAKAAAAGFSVPAVPAVATTNVGNAESWQALASQVSGFGGWLVGNPAKALVAVSLAFVLGWVVPRYVQGEGE
jgi:peptidoglycan L-alanyl-D-glutamate endopeptidase CwlK